MSTGAQNGSRPLIRIPSEWCRRGTVIVLAGIVLIGIGMRFYRITESEFVFYDEGYYLNYFRAFTDMAARQMKINPRSFFLLLDRTAGFSLASAKPLWFFILNMRAFFLGPESWWFPRVVSAVSGTLALLITFLFAQRLCRSRVIAGLSAAFLAVLPGHVFYSRLAMQEAFSGLLFLGGFYLYLFPRKLSYRTFFSGILFGGVFFTNYRMIIIPALVLLCEIYTSCAENQRIDLRKYLWNTLMFLCCVFLIGNMYGAHNTRITFAWMFLHSHLADRHPDPLGFLAYPYYLIRLESIFLAALFFGNMYYAIKRRWRLLFPFVIVVAQMALFSFSQDKAARYIGVVLPFVAMAAAYFCVSFFMQQKSGVAARSVVAVTAALALVTMGAKSFALAGSRVDYKTSVDFLRARDPQPKIVSTQRYIQNLYTPASDVQQCPSDFLPLVALYQAGYRYLIIDPQAYVSWAKDNLRFNDELIGFMHFIEQHITPIQTFPHFNAHVLERFVFDHNENMMRSIRFLASGAENRGALRVYDLGACVAAGLRGIRALEESGRYTPPAILRKQLD